MINTTTAGLIALLAVLVVCLAACSGSESRGSASTATATSGPDTTTPPTTAAPTAPASAAPTTTESTEPPPPPTYPLSVSIAFMDACVTQPGDAGRCACAARGFAESLPPAELTAFAEQFDDVDLTTERALTEELLSTLDACADAAFAAPTTAALGSLVEACTQGDERLTDVCACAVDRASLIVPSDALDDYAARSDVAPSLIDLINRCLT